MVKGKLSIQESHNCEKMIVAKCEQNPKVLPFIVKLLRNTHFTVVLFVFQFFQVCNFGKFINSRRGTVSSEMVKMSRLQLLDLHFVNLLSINVIPIFKSFSLRVKP